VVFQHSQWRPGRSPRAGGKILLAWLAVRQRGKSGVVMCDS
jgi:hypothetical protein